MIQRYGNSGRPVDADGDVAEGGKVGEADSDDVGEALGDTDTLGADVDAGDEGDEP
jgi:hypothetical protein